MIKAALAALAYFTRCPVPAKLVINDLDLAKGMRFFPWIGLLVGLLQLAILWLMQAWMPINLAILTCVLFSIWLTGALHEDGLADCADAFGGGHGDRQRIFAIMKDSRLGTYGVLALISIVLWRISCLQQLQLADLALLIPFAHVASRYMTLLLSWWLPYVQVSGKSQFHWSPLGLAVASVCVLLFLPIITVKFWFISISLLAVLLIVLKSFFHKNLAGFTGDCLGASQQLAEALLYGVWIILCAASS